MQTKQTNPIYIQDAVTDAFVVEEKASGIPYIHVDTSLNEIEIGNGTNNPACAFVGTGVVSVGGQISSSVVTGTAPLVVASTTLVSNLNAELWSGNEFSDYLDQPVREADSVVFSAVTSSIIDSDSDENLWLRRDGDMVLSLAAAYVLCYRTDIFRDVNSSYLQLGGGNSAGSGGRVTLFGPTHATSASTVTIGLGAVTVITCTSSACTIDMPTTFTENITGSKSLIMTEYEDVGEGYVDFANAASNPESPTGKYTMVFSPTSASTDYYEISDGVDGQEMKIANDGSVTARISNIRYQGINYLIIGPGDVAIIQMDDTYSSGMWRAYSYVNN